MRLPQQAYFFVLILMILSNPGRSQGYYWTVATIAGNDGLEFLGDGGLASDAEVGLGLGITFCPSLNKLFVCNGTLGGTTTKGRIYYIDFNDGTIHNYIGNGVVNHADSIDRSLAQVSKVGSMAFDHLGQIYFTEFGDNRIKRINTDDLVVHLAGTGEDEQGGDSLLAFYEADNIGVRLPLGIAQSPADSMIYWMEINCIRRYNHNNGKVELYAGDTNFVATIPPANSGDLAVIGQTLDLRGGLAFDWAGDMYYTTQSHTIQKIDHVTRLITTLAGIPGGPGYTGDGPALTTRLDAPYGLKFDNYGVLHWVENNNGMIRTLRNDSVITVIGKSAYSVLHNTDINGEYINADSVQMGPYDLAFDNNNDIYVMDGDNTRVRKFYRCYHPEIAGLSNYNHSPCPADSVQIEVDGTLGSAMNWYLHADSPDGEILDSGATLTLIYESGRDYYVTADGSSPSECILPQIAFQIDFNPDESQCNQDFTVFTPNEDGMNEYLHIRLAEKYPDNEVRILNRNGDVVTYFEDYSNTDNTWSGQQGNGKALTGTYFVLFKGYNDDLSADEFSYWVQLIR